MSGSGWARSQLVRKIPPLATLARLAGLHGPVLISFGQVSLGSGTTNNQRSTQQRLTPDVTKADPIIHNSY